MDAEESPSAAEHRLRLRPWLESMLDNQKVHGLEWLDQSRCYFKIPWKHRSKKDWDMEHIKVFLEWARHTGKYRDGERPDFVAMKTRLRCAFNKAPDIAEVKNLHSLKSSDPYKVYCFTMKPGAEGRLLAGAAAKISHRVCAVPPMRQTKDGNDDSLTESSETSSSEGETRHADDEANGKLDAADSKVAKQEKVVRRRKRKSKPRRYRSVDDPNIQANCCSDDMADCKAQKQQALELSEGSPENQATLDAAKMLLAFTNHSEVLKLGSAAESKAATAAENIDKVQNTSDLIPNLLRQPRRIPPPHIRAHLNAPIWLPDGRQVLIQDISQDTEMNGHTQPPYLHEPAPQKHNLHLNINLKVDANGQLNDTDTKQLLAKQTLAQLPDAVRSSINIPKVTSRWQNRYKTETTTEQTLTPGSITQTIKKELKQVQPQGNNDTCVVHAGSQASILPMPSFVDSPDVGKTANGNSGAPGAIQKKQPTPQQMTIRERVLEIIRKRGAADNIQQMSAPAHLPDNLGAQTMPHQASVDVHPLSLQELLPSKVVIDKHGKPKLMVKDPGRRRARKPRNVNKVLTRRNKLKSISSHPMTGLTFSGTGNIMAPGFVNGKGFTAADSNLISPATTLAEETIRMREAYGVSVAASSGPTAAELKDEEDLPPKLLPISSVDSLTLYRQARKDSHGNKSHLEATPENKDDLILDLRTGPGDASLHPRRRLSRNEGEALDLRLHSEDGEELYYQSAPALLTAEGALDLTLKRKTLEDETFLERHHKKLNVGRIRQIGSLAHVWDLSKEKTQSLGGAGCSPELGGAVDLRHSPLADVKPTVRVKEESEEEEGSEEPVKVVVLRNPQLDVTLGADDSSRENAADSGAEKVKPGTPAGSEPADNRNDNDTPSRETDHNYFSTKPLAYNDKASGVTVLECTPNSAEPPRKNSRENRKVENGCDSDSELSTPLPTVVSSQREKAEDMMAEMDEVRAVRHLLELSQPNKGDKILLPSEEVIQEALRETARKSRESGRKHNLQVYGAIEKRTTSYTPAANMKTDGQTRQRLRPWLESMINCGEIKGLVWQDRDQGIFKVPWKHGGKHDWTSDDSRIFMEWAKHTGRYREGIDDEDYATWKTRLRCAFNKAPDIVEIKDQTNLGCAEPFRVYRLIPKKDLHRYYSPSQSDDDEDKPKKCGVAPLPLFVTTMMDTSKGAILGQQRYPSDLRSIHSGDLVHPMAQDPMKGSGAVIEEQAFPSDPDTGAPKTECVVHTYSPTPVPTLPELQSLMPDMCRTTADMKPQLLMDPEAPMLPSLDTTFNTLEQVYQVPDDAFDVAQNIELTVRAVSDHEMLVDDPETRTVATEGMTIQLKLKSKLAKEDLVEDGIRCIVASSSENPEIPPEAQYQICYPSIQQSPGMTETELKMCALLPFISQGILLHAENGNIIATRRCRCGVHYISNETKGDCVKLKCNDENVTIFDYTHFSQLLQLYRMGEAPEPSPEVHLLLGQTCTLGELDDRILISMTVTSNKARTELLQMENMETEDEEATFHLADLRTASMLSGPTSISPSDANDITQALPICSVSQISSPRT